MAKKIKLDSKNYRKHSTENHEMINKSLRELGAGRSVLMDNEDELTKVEEKEDLLALVEGMTE